MLDASKVESALLVRRVRAADISQVIALDTRVTKLAKAEYWNDIFRRYGKQRSDERFFLVADNRKGRPDSRLLGFIIGEVRAWEFGSTPCGWVFALSVEPKERDNAREQQCVVTVGAENCRAGFCERTGGGRRVRCRGAEDL